MESGASLSSSSGSQSPPPGAATRRLPHQPRRAPPLLLLLLHRAAPPSPSGWPRRSPALAAEGGALTRAPRGCWAARLGACRPETSCLGDFPPPWRPGAGNSERRSRHFPARRPSPPPTRWKATWPQLELRSMPACPSQNVTYFKCDLLFGKPLTLKGKPDPKFR